MNKMDLDNIIITQQQEEGLAAFRKQQKEVEELQDKDFFAFYICWQNFYFQAKANLQQSNHPHLIACIAFKKNPHLFDKYYYSIPSR